MDRATFEEHLKLATERLLPFTREMVVDTLPDEVRYLVRTNQSSNDEPVGDEELYLQDGDGPRKPVTAEQVVTYLHRAGKVPEWIDATVDRTDRRFTYVRLDCCARFTADEELVYHQAEGHPRFHCLSPSHPVGWESPERSGRFRLGHDLPTMIRAWRWLTQLVGGRKPQGEAHDG